MKTHKVIIADDHAIFREGLKLVLTQILKLDVVAEASSGRELPKLLVECKPDIVLMDIKMPETDGVKATKDAVKHFPLLKIIALTMFDDIQNYYKMLKAGAHGFVTKSSTSEELAKAIDCVMAGELYFSQNVLTTILNNFSSYNKETNVVKEFTEREIEIMNLVCQGYSNSEIASNLNLSMKTIESFKTKLFAKTKTKNSQQLILFAMENKMPFFRER